MGGMFDDFGSGDDAGLNDGGLDGGRRGGDYPRAGWQFCRQRQAVISGRWGLPHPLSVSS